jgi:hypothetical protein
MRRYGPFKALNIALMIVIAVAVFGEVVMHLWNWLMPSLFGLGRLTFTQALGLLVLSKLLFGGFHRHGGGFGWRGRMQERWARMTPEEQERFRSGVRGRRGCGFGRVENPTTEQAPVA